MGKMSALPLAAALSMASAAGAPAAAKDVAKFAITPASADALIIVKTADVPHPPGYKTAWRMGLQAYDPAGQKVQSGPFGGQEVLASRPKSFVDGYLVEVMKPGTYVFRDFSRQDWWSLCCNGASCRRPLLRTRLPTSCRRASARPRSCRHPGHLQRLLYEQAK